MLVVTVILMATVIHDQVSSLKVIEMLLQVMTVVAIGATLKVILTSLTMMALAMLMVLQTV
jgi:hypothetical protein